MTDKPYILSEAIKRRVIEKSTFTREDEDSLKLIKHLSDPTKLKILLILNEAKEVSVNDLADILQVTQSAVSHALSDLKKQDLVECRRCSQLKCYSLNEEKLEHNLNSIVSKLK